MLRSILVPLDRSPLAEQALGQAAAIARASTGHLDLVLVHQPLPFAGFSDAPWNGQAHDDEQVYLDAVAAELQADGISVTSAVMSGDPVDLICRRAVDVNADLIVMTSHGRTGLSRFWLGSVADGVLRTSSVPVLLLRPISGKTRRDAAHQPFKRIVVPLDGSGEAGEMLASAAMIARVSDSRVSLLRVVQPVPVVLLDAGLPFAYPPGVRDEPATQRLVEDAKQQVADAARELRRDGATDVDAHVAVDVNVAQAILDFARGIDANLIAMSSHGRGASRLVLGSVADKVLRGSPLPMLLRRTERARTVISESDRHVAMNEGTTPGALSTG